MSKNGTVLLIFDGDCSFCTSSANWAVKHSKTPIQATPWQFTNLDDYGLNAALASEKVWMVVDGKKYGGSDAAAIWLIIKKNPLAKLAGHLMMFVAFRWIFALGYKVIAKNRHRMPGGTPACAMPSQKPTK